MPVPVLAFLGGAAIGAAAAWLVKDRLDRRTFEDEIDSTAEAAATARERAAGALEDVTEMAQATAAAAPAGPRQARSAKNR